MEILLDARCDPCVQDWRGWTALHVAANQGHVACVEVLLSFVARVGGSEEGGPVVGQEGALQLARLVDGLGRTALHVWSYTRELRSFASSEAAREATTGKVGEALSVSRAFQLLVRASWCSFSKEVDGGWTPLHASAAVFVLSFHN